MGNPQPIKITSITLIMYLVYLIFDVISIKGVIFDCFKNALVERKLLFVSPNLTTSIVGLFYVRLLVFLKLRASFRKVIQ